MAINDLIYIRADTRDGAGGGVFILEWSEFGWPIKKFEQKIWQNKMFSVHLHCNYLTMLILLDPQMKKIHDVLFGPGAILDGYTDAYIRLKSLTKLPYTIGIKERGTRTHFVSALDDLYVQIEEELNKFSENLEGMLNRKMESFECNSTVSTFLIDGLDFLIKGSRLLDVIEHKHHYTSSQSRVNQESYEMLRFYWTSEIGKKYRGVNKNMGNSNQTAEKIAEKILQLLGFFEITKSESRGADLYAKKGLRHYEVDLKINDRKELIQIFSLVSLWGTYKKIYG